jgi:hypothetical protein
MAPFLIDSHVSDDKEEVRPFYNLIIKNKIEEASNKRKTAEIKVVNESRNYF